MDANFKITSHHLLAVEGKDEANFFKALLEDERITGVQIANLGGKEKFRVELPLLMILEEFRDVAALGFVRDAEEHFAQSAFDSMRATLTSNHLAAPASLGAFATGQPKIGIFIMPDNHGAGMLEHLCLNTLEGQPAAGCINEYVACISSVMPSEEQKQFNEPKARVQTYLAGRTPIVNSLGLAALKGYWDFQHPCFTELKQFLHGLFDQQA